MKLNVILNTYMFQLPNACHLPTVNGRMILHKSHYMYFPIPFPRLIPSFPRGGGFYRRDGYFRHFHGLCHRLKLDRRGGGGHRGCRHGGGFDIVTGLIVSEAGFIDTAGTSVIFL